MLRKAGQRVGLNQVDVRIVWLEHATGNLPLFPSIHHVCHIIWIVSFQLLLVLLCIIFIFLHLVILSLSFFEFVTRLLIPYLRS